MVRRQLNRLKRTYRQRYGVVVCTDFARELFPDYAKSKESRTAYGAAVQKAASLVADEVFDDLLKRKSNSDPVVFFTAGGTGAGKTTVIASSEAFAASLADARLIYDSNLNSFNSAKEKIDNVLARGLSAVVLYVHRDPIESFFYGVLRRAMREGRVVSISAHARLHSECAKTIKKLAKEYSDRKRLVRFYVLHSVMGEKPRLKPIEFLDGIKYSRDTVQADISAILDSYYAGKVPEPINTAIRVSN